MKRDLTFNPNGGVLAVALGIDRQRCKLIDSTINEMIDQNANKRDIIEHLNTLDLTDAEWTVAIYALGYFEGVNA